MIEGLILTVELAPTARLKANVIVVPLTVTVDVLFIEAIIPDTVPEVVKVKVIGTVWSTLPILEIDSGIATATLVVSATPTGTVLTLIFAKLAVCCNVVIFVWSAAIFASSAVNWVCNAVKLVCKAVIDVCNVEVFTLPNAVCNAVTLVCIVAT